MSTRAERDLRAKRAVWVIALLSVVVIVWLMAASVPSPTPAALAKDAANERAVIRLIKENYEPSLQLLELHPDVQSMGWGAFEDSSDECPHCWRVFFTMNTFRDGETKTIDATWMADPTTGQVSPRDTAARMLFDKKL